MNIITKCKIPVRRNRKMW